VIAPSDVEERLGPGPLTEAVADLARRKARAVAAQLDAGVVLGADTVVVVDGDALGKPADAAEARAMLRRLRGREHQVLTGVAVVDAASGREHATVVTTRVMMARYTDADIDAYVATGEPLDKAGAYAIQDRGGVLVNGLAGSYTNVIGLPLAETRALLQAFGVAVSGPASRPPGGAAP
jgi:septum formation protein